jgi:hypothetical protein
MGAFARGSPIHAIPAGRGMARAPTPGRHEDLVNRRRTIALAVIGLAILALASFVRGRRVAGARPTREAWVEGVADTSRSVADPEPPARAASISGHVRSHEGQSIAGARVCATAVVAEAIGVPRATCAVADRDGQYAIEDLPPQAYSVAGEAEGYRPAEDASDPVILEKGEQKAGVDIVLFSGGAKVAGVVMDATGGPVAGATVRATRNALPFRAVAVASREDGTFALWVAPGAVVLDAEAVGYARGHLLRVAPTGDVVFRLTPGSRISGKVVSGVDDEAVAGVEVRAVPTDSWPSPRHPSAVSGADGAFSIVGLEPGALTLVAEGLRWRGQSAVLQVGLAQAIDEVVLKVGPAAVVSGRVIERASGEPCARGSVTLGPTSPRPSTPYDPPWASRETSVSAVPSIMTAIAGDGSVQFRGVPPGRYHAAVQCTDRLLSEGPTTLEVHDADVTGVEWRVSEGVGLVVHVVDGAGNALPNARFTLFYPPAPATGASGLVMPLKADLDGRYEAPRMLYPGTYSLRPSGGYEGSPLDVELRDGMGKVEATLRLDGSGSIVATVKTASGATLDDVTVTATPAGGDAGAPGLALSGAALGSGRFRIGPLSAGRYRVRVDDGVNAPSSRSEGQGQDVVEVRQGAATEATLVLDQGGHIRGRVVDGNQQGVPDVWVSATCSDGPPEPVRRGSPPPGMIPASRRVISDPTGQFQVDGLAPGTSCTVRAEQPYGPVGLKADVRPGDDITVPLPALGVLSGTAMSEGTPVEQFTMTLEEAHTGRRRSETVTAPRGAWRLERVVPGQIAIVASDGRGGTAQGDVTLGEGEARGGVALQFSAPSAER